MRKKGVNVLQKCLRIGGVSGYSVQQSVNSNAKILGIGGFSQTFLRPRARAAGTRFKALTISSWPGCCLSQTVNANGKLLGLGSFNQYPLHTQKKGWQSKSEYTRYRVAIKSMGMCFCCSELDFSVLEQHHIFGRKNDEITVTMCANCHTRLHYYLGGRRNKWFGKD